MEQAKSLRVMLCKVTDGQYFYTGTLERPWEGESEREVLHASRRFSQYYGILLARDGSSRAQSL